MTTATAPKCAAIEMPTNSASAPTAAPTTVPTLNAAWNSGITVRPSTRSLAAPSTFIATSHSRSRRRTAPARRTPPAEWRIASRRARRCQPDGAGEIAAVIVRRTEHAQHVAGEDQPDDRPGGQAEDDPAHLPVVACRESRMAGVLDTQLESPSPPRPKMTNTALRQPTICVRVSAGAVVMVVRAGTGCSKDPLGRRADMRAGRGSNRFDPAFRLK